jgi:nitroimidazol reductase NimA-like FMN-containing flavoprotein (pyridoxamine 5'-phosphate oxidase superfamily)
MSRPSTTITRIAEKGSNDRQALDRLLDEIHIGHFGIVADGHPVVIPTAIVRNGDRVLVHGSTGSRWMRMLAEGVPTSLAVTAFDGLVIARSAFESSMHYRSAVLFGRCTRQSDVAAAMAVVTEALLPGRAAELRASTTKELAATMVLSMPIEHWSLKISDSWPEDPADDVDGPAWAGVIPARITYDAPRAAPDLHGGIAAPASVRAFAD